jgi:DNA-directed RNA polymerase specialized sigma24 family protein
MTDKEAFDRLKQGDKEALASVYRKSRDSFVHKLMGWWYNCDEFEAQEIYLESVARLATKATELKSNTSLKTLLWGFCKNVYKEFKRGQLKEQNDLEKFFDYSNRISQEPKQSKGFEVNTAIEVMMGALENLKDDCKKILKAHYGIYETLETSDTNNKALTDEAIGQLYEPPKSADAIKMKRRRCEEKLGEIVLATLKKSSNGID